MGSATSNARRLQSYRTPIQLLESRRLLYGFAFNDSTYPSGEYPMDIVSADFDSDGDVDIATWGQDKRVAVMRNVGDGTFESPTTSPEVGELRQWSHMLTGDFNCDGHIDIALGSYFRNTLSILLNGGDASFVDIVNVPLKSIGDIAAADVDADGDVDLVASSARDRTLRVLRNDGGGHFATETLATHTSRGASVVIVDFDRDGYLDLVTSASTSGWGTESQLEIFRNRADGTFEDPMLIRVGQVLRLWKLADLNGDGHLDIVNALGGDIELWIHYSTGQGSFEEPVSVVAGWEPYDIYTEDFDQDGLIDLMTANHETGDITLLRNRGGGTFASAVWISGNWHGFSSQVDDFDGDGDLDVVLGIYWENRIVVLQNVSTFDQAAPQLVSVEFRHTVPQALLIRFDEPMDRASLQADEVTVMMFEQPTFAVIPTLHWQENNTVVEVRFGSLPDGNYRFSLPPGFATDVEGLALESGLTVEGPDVFVFAGDFNGDRRIDFADLLIVAQRRDGLGFISYSDLQLVSQRYGTVLCPPMSRSIAFDMSLALARSLVDEDEPGIL